MIQVLATYKDQYFPQFSINSIIYIFYYFIVITKKIRFSRSESNECGFSSRSYPHEPLKIFVFFIIYYIFITL